MRRQPPPTIPPAEIWAEQEIPVEIISAEDMENIFAEFSIETDSSKLDGMNIAVDLDDTLLFGSFTVSNLWSLGSGYGDKNIVDGYAYAKMRKSLRGRYNALLGRPGYDQICRRTNPYMEYPRVVVALNTPLVSALNWAKTRGANLALVTASARQRADYLTRRLPILNDLFGNRVMAAEDIAARLLDVDLEVGLNTNETTWTKSFRIHANRPNSLAAKSPWLVSPLFDGQSFDMLLDDSNVTYEAFQKSGLESCLFRIHHHDLDREKLWMQAVQFGAGVCLSECKLGGAGGFPEFHDTLIEDVLYWPLLHKDDQLDWGADHG